MPAARRAGALARPGDRPTTGTSQTALDATVAEASRPGGPQPSSRRWISIRSGVLLAEVDDGMLRAAIGPGRVQIEGQAAALEHLGDDRLPAALTDLSPAAPRPWPDRARRLVARAPPPRHADLRGGSSEPLAEECRASSSALHGAPGGEGPGPSATALAETVAASARRRTRRRARSLGARLDESLGAVRRGFGHGDFFAGNLLSAADRLTGVLDWDAAGPGRLPLVDLLHLELTQAGYGTDDDWGPALLARLLPASRAGGSECTRRYCHDAGYRSPPLAARGTRRLVLALVRRVSAAHASCATLGAPLDRAERRVRRARDRALDRST